MTNPIQLFWKNKTTRNDKLSAWRSILSCQNLTADNFRCINLLLFNDAPAFSAPAMRAACVKPECWGGWERPQPMHCRRHRLRRPRAGNKLALQQTGRRSDSSPPATSGRASEEDNIKRTEGSLQRCSLVLLAVTQEGRPRRRYNQNTWAKQHTLTWWDCFTAGNWLWKLPNRKENAHWLTGRGRHVTGSRTSTQQEKMTNQSWTR